MMPRSVGTSAGQVVRCSICNKPFDKHSTLKRHEYYCRTRKGAKTSRTRSCYACVKAKTKCDSTRPQCSSCATKNRDCLYPNYRPEPKSKNQNQKFDRWPPLEPLELVLGTNLDPENVLGNVPFDVDVALANLECEAYLLDNDYTLGNLESKQVEENYSMDFGSSYNASWAFMSTFSTETLEDVGASWTTQPDILQTGAKDELLPILVLSSTRMVSESSNPPLASTSIYSKSCPATTVPEQQLELYIPPAPTDVTRSILPRPTLYPWQKRLTSLIWHTLKSYPSSVIYHNTLPPFIHPSHALASPSPDNEALVTALTLLNILRSPGSSSQKLFWKNTSQELARFVTESRTMTEHELTSCMQALFLYVLVRITEGEKEWNDWDYHIISALCVLASRYRHLDNDSILQRAPQWDKWVLQESRVRLEILFRVINMLVYLAPDGMCTLPMNIVMGPLPARKEFWEALDEEAWKSETEKALGTQRTFAIVADGSLVELAERRLHEGHEIMLHLRSEAGEGNGRERIWEDWASGMDGLGALIMLAAALVGQ